ncbi:insulinase family protein [Reinekea marina]|uniref:M16 family metallopeptidase n=1 Tax=Reinekea marina TaxID=1310421 RepID=A0ABV7WRF7_9GAMM|nr:M16 family metallopeptidase [Reinekea marina]MDN3647314.1 insulinase family protein [Reinekea marina]MDN3651070.1 insulinase family protein [Reinekea marina]
MKKSVIGATLSAVVLAGCSVLSSQSTERSQVVSFSAEQAWQAVPDRHIQSGTLPNGLDWHVKTLPDNGSRDRVELRLRIRSGSLVETDTELGLAHFVEHMAFNGTERFPKNDIVEFFESAGMSFGGDINAHTSFGETVYKLTIPADQPELIKTAFEVMYDWATAISFAQEEVSKEAPVVIEEWRSNFGTEEQSWLQEYNDLYQGTHLLNRLPIGDNDIVASATATQLRDYYQKWYRPDNAEFVVVYPEGVFDAVETINTVFTPWTAEPTPEINYALGAVAIEGSRFKGVTDSNVTSHQWQLYLPVHRYGSDTPIAREIDFIDQVYTSVLSARLQRLGEVSDAAIIDAGSQIGEFFEQTKYLNVWATAYDGQQNQALNDITLELNRLQRYGITASEFATAKQKILMQNKNIQSWLQGADSGSHADYLMYFLSTNMALEDIDAAVIESEKMAAAVKLEKINHYIAQTIGSQDLAAYFYHPKTITPETQDWAAIYAKAWQQEVSSPVETSAAGGGLNYEFRGSISQEFDLTEEEGLFIWALENGITVVLKQSDIEPSRVYTQTMVFGGNRQMSNDLIAASEQWSEVRIRSGLEGRSGQDFFDKLDLDGIGYNVFIDGNASGVELSGQADQLGQMLKLTSGSLTDVALNEQMIALTLNSSVEHSAQYQTTPTYEFEKQFLAAVYGVEDPRYVYFSPDDIAAVTSADLVAVQESILKDNQGVIVAIVGDVTPDQVAPALKTYLAGLPLPGPSVSRSLGPITTESRFIRVAGQAEEKTDITYLFAQTELPVDVQRYLASEVMIQAVEKRLHKAIREDSGLTYGTAVSQGIQTFDQQQWQLQIHLSTEPAREKEALTALDETLQKLIETPLTDQEVLEASHRVAESEKQNLATNTGILNNLTGILFLGGDITDYDNGEAMLATVTTEQVNDLLGLLLNGKKVVAVHHP